MSDGLPAAAIYSRDVGDFVATAPPRRVQLSFVVAAGLLHGLPVREDSNFAVKTTTQLAVLVGNRPGGLARLCRELSDADINIDALSISDAVESSMVRMVVSDTRKAVDVLAERGVVALECEVLMLEHDNKPGTLAGIADRLSRAGVNIEYVYLAMGSSDKALMIIRPSDIHAAKDALRDLE